VIAVSDYIIVMSLATPNAFIWLMTARFLWRRWRPGGVAPLTYEEKEVGYRNKYHTVEWKPGFAVAIAMAAAVMWPLVLAVGAITLRQPPTAAEMKEKAEEPERRLARRERELDLAERELNVATGKMKLAVAATPEDNAIAECENAIVKSFGVPPASARKPSHRGSQKDPLAGAGHG
jgi:hypothetical protein